MSEKESPPAEESVVLLGVAYPPQDTVKMVPSDRDLLEHSRSIDSLPVPPPKGTPEPIVMVDPGSGAQTPSEAPPPPA